MRTRSFTLLLLVASVCLMDVRPAQTGQAQAQPSPKTPVQHWPEGLVRRDRLPAKFADLTKKATPTAKKVKCGMEWACNKEETCCVIKETCSNGRVTYFCGGDCSGYQVKCWRSGGR